MREEPIEIFGIEVPPPTIDGMPIRSVDPLRLSKAHRRHDAVADITEGDDLALGWSTTAGACR